mmetsp:Transcript_23948/g.26856  ORF Transcript_23948/g.26856 Transcript_23948/m.26856 type:complete len:252 (+) Transcript_23948:203-958(+)
MLEVTDSSDIGANQRAGRSSLVVVFPVSLVIWIIPALFSFPLGFTFLLVEALPCPGYDLGFLFIFFSLIPFKRSGKIESWICSVAFKSGESHTCLHVLLPSVGRPSSLTGTIHIFPEADVSEAVVSIKLWSKSPVFFPLRTNAKQNANSIVPKKAIAAIVGLLSIPLAIILLGTPTQTFFIQLVQMGQSSGHLATSEHKRRPIYTSSSVYVHSQNLSPSVHDICRSYFHRCSYVSHCDISNAKYGLYVPSS